MARELIETEKDASKEITNIISGNASASTDKYEKISHILEYWTKIEGYTIERYGLLANQTSNRHAKVMFERLSSAGERHTKILGITKEILTETGEIDQSVHISSHVIIPENTKPRIYLTDVEETYHAMKSHLELEQGLKETYEEMAGQIKDPRAIALLRALVGDEKSHHRELLEIIEMFEKTFKDKLRN